ncbi:GDP-L-fucose synthase [Salegentibacter sp. JZCK2]|uniref:GDP-L-fucose synthase family protein n=1 Tax=Salegentibacter tibetensis TaxID=2873600 RepID=UPI001CCBF896|nr:GDP-L-fucose synthase [Salegentibacter tibetensis]MBZ9731299.1 GDP-L-fucose synthase [Salegentibacter tibetensis]
MKKNAKIYVAGHQGLVGSAIYSNLKKKGYSRLITRTHKELDLIDCHAVEEFFESEKPEFVFLAAAKVGGIVANNTYRAEFIYENLMIQSNVIHQAFRHGIKKLLFLGSTCIYPRDSPQPIKEEYLLTDILEYTNEPYAIAKIAGIKMCESYNLQYGTNFISVMPTNLYGPGDNFDLETSHVLPALIRKIHLGKALEENDWETISDDFNRRPIEGIDGSQGRSEMLEVLRKYGIKALSNNEEYFYQVEVEIWGSGKQIREFLWSDDMAEACVFLMENVNFSDLIPLDQTKDEIRNTQINIGTGREITIAHLAEIVKIILKFKGELFFNTDKPEGTARKLTDVSKLKALGWKYEVELDEGVNRLYRWYKSSINRSVIR